MAKRQRLKAADIERLGLPPDQWPTWYKPARGSGGDRPASPFQPGNIQALTAGGHRSPRVYGAVARALADGLLEERADLARFPEAIASWADAEARAAILRHNLDEAGMFGEDGKLRQARVTALAKFETRAARERQALGLDPTSEAKLALVRAKAVRLGLGLSLETEGESLEALAAKGRAALQAGDPLVRGALEQVEAQAPPRKPKREVDE